jgi:hypothetical protein
VAGYLNGIWNLREAVGLDGDQVGAMSDEDAAAIMAWCK